MKLYWTFERRIAKIVRVFVLLPFFFLGGNDSQNEILVLGTNSYGAATVNRLPAKRNVNHRVSWLYKRLIKKLILKNRVPSGPETLITILLVFATILAILLGVWAVGLFMAGNFLSGISIGFLGLLCLVLVLIEFFSFYV